MNAAELLEIASKLYIEKNKEYGDSYLQHGRIMDELFPKGIALENSRDHARFGMLTMVVGKLTRFCNNFACGHEDSLDDLIVYAAMLRELYEDENSTV